MAPLYFSAGQTPVQIASLTSPVPSVASRWLLTAEVMHCGNHNLHFPPPGAPVLQPLIPGSTSSSADFSYQLSVGPPPLWVLPHSHWSQLLHPASHSWHSPCYTCGLLVDLPGGWCRLPSNRRSASSMGFVPCGV